MSGERDLGLEAQIARSPRDATLFAVYADWLAERGDPRGELITTVLALESNPDNAELRARANELHALHDAEWLGRLAHPEIRVRWRRGFVDSVAFGQHVPAFAEDEVETLYGELRALPIAALLREVTFGPIRDDEMTPSWEGIVDAIARDGAPDSLRRLAFRRGIWPPYSCHIGGLDRVYPHVPKLHVLRVDFDCRLGALELPNLRELDLYVPELSRDDRRALAAAPFAKLEALALRYGIDSQPAIAASSKPEHVLDRPFPRLSRLTVTGSLEGDPLVRWLATAPLVKQLRALDLSYGYFTEDTVEAMLAATDAFRGLERLVITRSDISRAAVRELRAALPNLVVGTDDDDDDDDDDE